MSFLMFIKILADLCLVFSILGAFPVFFASGISLLIPAVIGALGVGIAALLTDSGKEKLRFVCLAFALAVPLSAGSTAELLVLVPVTLYCAVIIIKGKFYLDYYDFRHFFRNSLIGLLIFTILVWFFSYIDTNTGGSVLNFDPAATLRFGVLYVIAGVILLRQLRLGAENQGHRVSHMQAAGLLGGVGAAVGVYLVMKHLLWEFLQTGLMKVMELFFTPVTYLFHTMGQLIDSIEGDGSTQPTETGTSPSIDVRPVPQETGAPATPPVEPEESTPWLAVIIMIAVIIMMIIMIRAFRSKGKGKVTGGTFQQITPEAKAEKQQRRSNRAKIRKYYRDFLKQEEKRGLKRRHDQTSLDILEELPKQANSRAAARLRDVYLHARYHDSEEITPQQVELAKAALKQSKEK